MDWPARYWRMIVALLLIFSIVSCGRGLDAGGPSCELSPGELIISEFMADPRGEQGLEWIELYNASSSPLVLDRLVLKVEGQSGVRSHILQQAGELAAGDYRVLASQSADYVDYVYGKSLSLNNDQGRVSLSCQGVESFVVGYGGDQPLRIQSGKSVALDSGIANESTQEGKAWCAGRDVYEIDNLGTPGQANPLCGVDRCEDAGLIRPSRHPAPGELLISEVFFNPAGEDANREWVELYVNASQPVDLNGVELRAPGQGGYWRVETPACLTAEPGDYPLLRMISDNQADDAPELPAALAELEGKPLANDFSRLELYRDDQLIDEASFQAVSEQGLSLSLDPEFRSNTGMEKRYCPARSTLFASTGEKATPGRANDPCGAACISEAGSWRKLNPPRQGELIVTEVMANPQGSDSQREWLELYVNTSGRIDLNDLQLLAEKPATDKKRSWQIRSERCLPVQPEDYLVVAASETPGESIPVSVVLPGLNLYNDAMQLSLLYDTEVIDVAALPESDSGVSTSLDAQQLDSAANDLSAAFCASRSPFPGGAATPASGNDPCGAYCLDNGQWRPLQSIQSGDLRISEIYPNPEGRDAQRDWLEVYVEAAYRLDLNGLLIQQELDEKRRRSWSVDESRCLAVDPGAYVVLGGENAETVDRVPVSAIVPGLDFYSSQAGEIALSYAGQWVDRALPVKAQSGAAVAVTDGLDNTDPQNWCVAAESSEEFLGLGSPAQANPAC